MVTASKQTYLFLDRSVHVPEQTAAQAALLILQWSASNINCPLGNSGSPVGQFRTQCFSIRRASITTDRASLAVEDRPCLLGLIFVFTGFFALPEVSPVDISGNGCIVCGYIHSKLCRGITLNFEGFDACHKAPYSTNTHIHNLPAPMLSTSHEGVCPFGTVLHQAKLFSK